MKRIIQNILAERFGVALSKQVIRQSLRGMLSSLKGSGYTPKWVLDVGAERGSWTLECHRFFPDSKYLLVEPRDEFLSQYASLSNSHHIDLRYELTALGAKEVESQALSVYPHNPSGSTLLDHYDEDKTPTIPKRVPVATLNSLRKKYGFSKCLLKLDVQGYELQALNGASECLKDMDVIFAECSMFRFYPQQPVFTEVLDYLDARDFVLHDISPIGYRQRDCALAQVDAIFVRRDSVFRNSHSWI